MQIDDPKQLRSFLEKRVRFQHVGECWIWTGEKLTSGYGRIQTATVDILAHRLSFYLTNGHAPKVVRHTCDNPPCVNPSHLLGGTHLDNMRDMKDRGRNASSTGELNPRAKLRDSEIDELRAEYQRGGISQSALARKWGLHSSYVSRLVRMEKRISKGEIRRGGVRVESGEAAA